MSAPPMFVTRKYPPSIGGMETLAAGVWEVLKASDHRALLVAHDGSNRQLPLWLPLAAWKVFWNLQRKQVGFVLIGDAATYAFLRPILRLFRSTHGTMVMGLDLTYGNSVYRAVVHRALRRAPLVVAISEATARTAEAIGIPQGNMRVVRPGILVPPFSWEARNDARSGLTSSLGIPGDSVLVLSLGRLVRRKGVRWFIENVLPSTATNVHYLVAGSGGEAQAIADAAERVGVADRLHMFGQVDDRARDQLFYGCDLLVQPNIHIPDDVEGFGLVIIEATLRGTPVVASDLQGIKDALIDGVTGVMVPPEADDDWRETINGLISDRPGLAALGETFRRNAVDLYSQDRMGRDLLAAIEQAPV